MRRLLSYTPTRSLSPFIYSAQQLIFRKRPVEENENSIQEPTHFQRHSAAVSITDVNTVLVAFHALRVFLETILQANWQQE